MQNSLRDIKRAIKGMIVMSADLDTMYTCFLNNQLPPIWEKVSFASLKTLGSWVTDMIFRVAFMRKWLVHGQPAAFPLPVFFFPQVPREILHIHPRPLTHRSPFHSSYFCRDS